MNLGEDDMGEERLRRKMTLGDWMDRLLIGAVAAIFIWFGTRIEHLTTKVENLLQAMATTVAKQDSADKRIDYVEKHIATIEEDMKDHFKEDRSRFGRMAK